VTDLPPRLREFLDDLAVFTDRADRIEALVSVARRFRPVPDDVATRPFDEAHRVPGCESEVFVWALAGPDGRLRLEFAVENPQGVSAMALAVVLQDALDGEPPESAGRVPDDLVFELFGRELSMGKSLGLTNTVRAVRAWAARLSG
jgi:cysteine desulfuration protein SufE